MKIFFKNIIAVVYLYLISLFVRNNDLGKGKNILFINTEQIGDIVVSSTLLESENCFKEYDNVYFLIKKEYIGLLANYMGRIKILSVDSGKFKNSISYNISFVKLLKRLNIKEVYNISSSRGQLNEVLTHVTGSILKYTMISDSVYLGKSFLKYWNRKYSKILFSDIRNEYTKTNKLLDVFCSNTRTIKSNVFLNNSPEFSNQSDYISISPYCSDSIKDWRVEKFKKLIKELEKNISVYIICSGKQKRNALKDFGRFKNVIITDIELSRVSDLIVNSKLFIGNDSGLTHLAIKLGVKTIAIIGGGTYGRFFPIPFSPENVQYKFNKLDCFGCNWECIYDFPRCMDVEIKI